MASIVPDLLLHTAARRSCQLWSCSRAASPAHPADRHLRAHIAPTERVTSHDTSLSLPQAVNVFGYGQRLKSPTSGALYVSLVHACLKCGSPLKAQQVHIYTALLLREYGSQEGILEAVAHALYSTAHAARRG